MSSPDMLDVLRVFVDAHARPDRITGRREPVLYLRHMGGASLHHHALAKPPHVDEATLDEMHEAGWVSLDHVEHGLKITPTPLGRKAIEDRDRVENADPVADVGSVTEAVAAQAESDAKLAWPTVRPILAAIRSYWEAGGFSRHGVQLPALVNALPEEHRGLFAASIRQFVEADYLRPTTELAAFELPAEVGLTERAHTVLDGWPGVGPDELVENLLAVLATDAAAEEDPTRKRRLEKLAETVREVGSSTAGEVLARVLMGGG